MKKGNATFQRRTHSIVRVLSAFPPLVPALYHIKHLNQCRTLFKSPSEVKYYLW